jgi:uncharacterized protein with beta-barrel porin domain
VAPRDARIFSAQDFVFAERNQDSVSALMGRTRPDGGGDTFYDLGGESGPAARGWMQVVGGFIDPGSVDHASFNANSGGIEGGADVALGGQTRLGGAVGYEASSLSDSDGGQASQDTLRLSLYASQTLGAVGLSAAVSYAHGWDDTDRASGLGDSVSKRGADEVTGAVQLAAPFSAGEVRLSPVAGVLVSSISSGAFLERNVLNAAFAVSGASSSATVVSPYATIGVSREFTTAHGVQLTPAAEVGYRYDASADGLAQTLFATDGTAFFGNQVRLDRNSALLGVSLTAHQGQWTGYLKYQASVSGNWSDQSLQAGLRMAF